MGALDISASISTSSGASGKVSTGAKNFGGGTLNAAPSTLTTLTPILLAAAGLIALIVIMKSKKG